MSLAELLAGINGGSCGRPNIGELLAGLGGRTTTFSCSYDEIKIAVANNPELLKTMNEALVGTPRALSNFIPFCSILHSNFKNIPWGNPQLNMLVSTWMYNNTDNVHNPTLDRVRALSGTDKLTNSVTYDTMKKHWDKFANTRVVNSAQDVQALLILLKKLNRYGGLILGSQKSKRGIPFQKMACFYSFLQRMQDFVPKLNTLIKESASPSKCESNKTRFPDDSDSD